MATTLGRFETLTSNRNGNTAAPRTFRYAHLANSALLQSLSVDGNPFTVTRTYRDPARRPDLARLR